MNAAKLIAAYADGVCRNEQNIPSPCISVCVMNPGTGLCSGCYRTLDEIASWSRMADAAKKQVWDQLMVRAQGDAKP